MNDHSLFLDGRGQAGLRGCLGGFGGLCLIVLGFLLRGSIEWADWAKPGAFAVAAGNCPAAALDRPLNRRRTVDSRAITQFARAYLVRGARAQRCKLLRVNAFDRHHESDGNQYAHCYLEPVAR